MKRWSRVFWPGPFIVARRRGALLLLDCRNYVDRELAFYGDYEREQTAFLLAAMRRHGCDLFIDVGANIGFYSVLAGNTGANVIAFEPDPRSLPQFSANVAMNGLSHLVELRAVALSDRAGEVAFSPAAATSTGQSRLCEKGAATVTAQRLDDALQIAGRLVFLKIDIEGHELAALAGMTRLLATNRCFLQVESFGDRAADLVCTMTSLGYRLLRNIGDDHYFANFTS
jgi:FkbM family methyltransferase